MYRNVEQYNITDIFLGCLLVVGKGAIPGGLVSFGFGVWDKVFCGAALFRKDFAVALRWDNKMQALLPHWRSCVIQRWLRQSACAASVCDADSLPSSRTQAYSHGMCTACGSSSTQSGGGASVIDRTWSLLRSTCRQSPRHQQTPKQLLQPHPSAVDSAQLLLPFPPLSPRCASCCNSQQTTFLSEQQWATSAAQ